MEIQELRARMVQPVDMKLKPDYKAGLKEVSFALSLIPLLAENQAAYVALMPSDSRVQVLMHPEDCHITLANIIGKCIVAHVDGQFNHWLNDISIGDKYSQVTSATNVDISPAIANFKTEGRPLYLTSALFDTGNLIVIEHGGSVKVLCGCREYHKTANYYDGSPRNTLEISPENYIAQLEISLNLDASSVCLIGEPDGKGDYRVQPEQVYHLDLFAIALGPSTIGVLNPDDIDLDYVPSTGSVVEHVRNSLIAMELGIHAFMDNGELLSAKPLYLTEVTWFTYERTKQMAENIYVEEKRQQVLKETKHYIEVAIAQFKSMGFEVVLFPTSSERILNFKGLNLIVHSNNKIIMPFYPDETGNYENEINLRTKTQLEEMGMQVKKHNDTGTNIFWGGPKCFFNRVHFQVR